ncbi:MAG: hypothetical protein GQ538_03460 [Xanthomonadales bacterium]|nr:hypothetical protein [Xanthomonadales bacterium]
MRRVSHIFLIFLTAYVLSLVLPPVWLSARHSCSSTGLLCWNWLEAIALSGAVVTGMLALYLSFTAKTPVVKAGETALASFPQQGTVHVLVWLLAALTVYIILFIKVLVPESIDETATFWLMILDNNIIREASVAFLAAGIGSTVSTMFSFLKHASTNADWKQSHIPWYILRPIQGSVLGIIFYWLVRGGLLAVVPTQDGQGYMDLDLNGLAGMCALVGMFSRRAMIKLRETFVVIFATNEDQQQKAISDKPYEPEDDL